MTRRTFFADRMRPTSLIPNVAGYRFTGIKRDGTRALCTVERGPDGLHRIKELRVTELVGWVPA